VRPEAERAAVLLHATCVAIGGRGVLIEGPSGSGKSDLALRLIDGGARLVADDQVEVAARDGRLHARAPDPLVGLIEARGQGLFRLDPLPEAPLDLAVTLAPPAERLPEPATRTLLGVDLPLVALDPFEASAPARLRLVLTRPRAHTG
jgi:HPr kinase/phosphorylase